MVCGQRDGKRVGRWWVSGIGMEIMQRVHLGGPLAHQPQSKAMALHLSVFTYTGVSSDLVHQRGSLAKNKSDHR